jgi:hypothetical protein
MISRKYVSGGSYTEYALHVRRIPQDFHKIERTFQRPKLHGISGTINEKKKVAAYITPVPGRPPESKEEVVTPAL